MRSTKSLAQITFIALMLMIPAAVLAQDAKPKLGEPNMGVTDRVIRTGLGVGLAAWGTVLLVDNRNTGYIPLGISVIPLVTAAIGRCPLYYIFGIDTREKDHDVSINLIPKGIGLQYSYRF